MEDWGRNMYKQYLLKGRKLIGDDSYDPETWQDIEYYFDTEKEMIEFVKKRSDFSFKVEAVFKIEKLSNNIFAEEI